MEIKLKGKVAVITGASSGIGESTALSLANLGVHVILLARRIDKLMLICKKIEKAGGKASAFALDISKEGEINTVVPQILELTKKVDILINNAGVMLLAPIARAQVKDWQQMIDTNLTGLLLITHALLPTIRKQKGGHIINISSVAGRTAGPSTSVYNATKWGVVGFTEALRQEVAMEGIRTCVIQPGAVATELQTHIPDPVTKKEIDTWIKNMEALQSEDISNIILFVLSQPEHVNINEVLVRPTKQSN